MACHGDRVPGSYPTTLTPRCTGFPDMHSLVNTSSLLRMKSKSRCVGTGDVVHALYVGELCLQKPRPHSVNRRGGLAL